MAHYKQALDFLAPTGERFGFEHMISRRFVRAEIDDAFAGMIDMTQTTPVITFR